MSSIIDKTFINRISPQLERFSWKKDNLANCRCPICGDSDKDKKKARGYFYQKENGFFYKCHNCNFGSNIYNFLKEVSVSLCKEYSAESFKEKTFGRKKKESEEVFKYIDKKDAIKPYAFGCDYSKLTDTVEEQVAAFEGADDTRRQYFIGRIK